MAFTELNPCPNPDEVLANVKNCFTRANDLPYFEHALKTGECQGWIMINPDGSKSYAITRIEPSPLGSTLVVCCFEGSHTVEGIQHLFTTAKNHGIKYARGHFKDDKLAKAMKKALGGYLSEWVIEKEL